MAAATTSNIAAVEDLICEETYIQCKNLLIGMIYHRGQFIRFNSEVKTKKALCTMCPAPLDGRAKCYPCKNCKHLFFLSTKNDNRRISELQVLKYGCIILSHRKVSKIDQSLPNEKNAREKFCMPYC